jgi:hypothetical protein
VLCPQRVSLPLKKAVICPQWAVLPVQLGRTARCRLKWQFVTLFKKFEISWSVWESAEDFNGCFARFKFLKIHQNGHYYLHRAATPDQITQQNSLHREGGH